MKKIILKNKAGLKEVLLEIAVVCMVALTMISLQSCNDKHNANAPYEEHNNTEDRMSGVNTKTEDPKDVAEEHNDAKFRKESEKEAQLMVDAADINLQEIELGKLAESKGTTKQVKDLGKMMVTDHTKALEELRKLAGTQNVTLPEAVSDKGRDEYNKLSEKTGIDFDKKYAEMMVDGHKDAIKKFEKCEEDCTDSQVKNWATKTLPVLRTHLDHSMACYDALKKDKSMK